MGELGLGDGRPAPPGPRLVGAKPVQAAIDLGVHLAEEERGHRVGPGQVTGTRLQTGEVGLDDLLVAVKGKINVTLMLRPSAIIWRTAGMPAMVAGIFTSRLGSLIWSEDQAADRGGGGARDAVPVLHQGAYPACPA